MDTGYLMSFISSSRSEAHHCRDKRDMPPKFTNRRLSFAYRAVDPSLHTVPSSDSSADRPAMAHVHKCTDAFHVSLTLQNSVCVSVYVCNSSNVTVGALSHTWAPTTIRLSHGCNVTTATFSKGTTFHSRFPVCMRLVVGAIDFRSIPQLFFGRAREVMSATLTLRSHRESAVSQIAFLESRSFPESRPQAAPMAEMLGYPIVIARATVFSFDLVVDGKFIIFVWCAIVVTWARRILYIFVFFLSFFFVPRYALWPYYLRQTHILSACSMNVRQPLWLLTIIVIALAAAEDDAAEKEFVPLKFVRPKVAEQGVYLAEDFADKKVLGKSWLKSTAKKDGVEEAISKYDGEWAVGSPEKVSVEGDYGLIVKSKAKHHAVAAKFNKPFYFTDNKPLVVQYEVKYQEGQECGGGYLKLLSLGAEKAIGSFNDKTPYTIMFGPDKCGASAKVHLIIRFTNPINKTTYEHHAAQPSSGVGKYFDDHATHLYTLIIRPDETFSVSVDNYVIMSGNLLSNVEPAITPPKQVADPTDVKPADWDDREMIVDEEDKKPDDWDESQPKQVVDESATKPDDWLEEESELIPDPEAKKPEDWDNDMDGEWEAAMIPNPACEGRSGCGAWKKPMIANPLYKGKWKPRKIKNPNYKGKWEPRIIDNPHYFEPQPFSQLEPVSAIGIELWTMSNGIIFDNMLVTDDEAIAADYASQTFAVKVAQEKAFESFANPSKGIFSDLVEATEERPWLWAVYVLGILLPVIGISIFCFGRKSTPVDDYDYKKTDEPQEDDSEIPRLVGDDDEEPEPTAPEEEDPSADTGSSRNSQEEFEHVSQAATTESAEEENDGNESEKSNKSDKKSPTQRRARPRRAD
uniref:Calnexin n=1 Tax=Steinernema glaseri TaxID=37863 RepID=A0A1I8AFR8_9BILA